MKSRCRLLIVGASGSSHIGASFVRAAADLGLEVELADVARAWRRGTLWQKALWQFDRRPADLEGFGQSVLALCEDLRPNVVITTGAAPLTRCVIKRCRTTGAKVVNFSTDDPFNPRQSARWFLSALSEYDVVFTPRRSNIAELLAHGVNTVDYLPFGYDKHLFYPVSGNAEAHNSDFFFAGAADRARVPYIAAALHAGFDVALHGINWERYRATRQITRGQADLATLRSGIAGCGVALCLVRHENRDGHSMRTFEVPAVGACMVVEDTVEHRDIFGAEGDCVMYFRNPEQMVTQAHKLLHDPELRRGLARHVHQRIVGSGNTYADRLQHILANAL